MVLSCLLAAAPRQRSSGSSATGSSPGLSSVKMLPGAWEELRSPSWWWGRGETNSSFFPLDPQQRMRQTQQLQQLHHGECELAAGRASWAARDAVCWLFFFILTCCLYRGCCFVSRLQWVLSWASPLPPSIFLYTCKEISSSWRNWCSWRTVGVNKLLPMACLFSFCLQVEFAIVQNQKGFLYTLTESVSTHYLC